MTDFAPRPLIYIHLPKAGGSTLQEVIVRQYAGGRSFRFTGDSARYAEFLALRPEARREFDLLLGHVQFGLHHHLPDPATYITMLRDPVERVISHYHFVRARPEHYLHESLRRRKFSLREWAAEAPLVIDNYQLRWLISTPVARIPPRGVTRSTLEEAKWNLEHGFEVIGLLERFDESLACLGNAFGWQNLEALERRNVNAVRPPMEEIDPEAIAVIRDLNRFDLELYEFASALFEAQCHRLKVDPRPALLPRMEAAMAAWEESL
jgi:hypothetical protein